MSIKLNENIENILYHLNKNIHNARLTSGLLQAELIRKYCKIDDVI